ncbi:hypothetical protein L596_029792 [Steinernema carpocapsae]|uniref:Uncharacterized protein n=1 Tax=Steinernema carpocapsae TaxID=34508 RepID=A0A4U5LQU7_STECR|nr:hypothetical protein L596_029792 [Steinernema carpocapsae]
MTSSSFIPSKSLIVSLLELVDRQGKALQTAEQRLTILENSAFESHAKWMQKENAALELCVALTKQISDLEKKLNVPKLDVLTQTDPKAAHMSTQTEATVDVMVDLSFARIDCSEKAEIVRKEPRKYVAMATINLRKASNLELPAKNPSEKRPKKKARKGTPKSTFVELPDHVVDSILPRSKFYPSLSDPYKHDYLSDFCWDNNGLDDLLPPACRRRVVRLFNTSANDKVFVDAIKIVAEACIIANTAFSEDVLNHAIKVFFIKVLEMYPARLEHVGRMFTELMKFLILSQNIGSALPSKELMNTLRGSICGLLMNRIVAYSKAACACAMGVKTSVVLKPKHKNLLKKIREHRYALIQGLCYTLHEANVLYWPTIPIMIHQLRNTQAEMKAPVGEMNTIIRTVKRIYRTAKTKKLC